MIKQVILVAAAGILLTLNSCQEGITGPGEDQPGRRDYTWTVDTLNIEAPAYKIWGSSPTDVWSINISPDLSNSFWHYDGSKWSTDGIFRLVSPHALFGFSNNNIYVG